MDWLALVTAFGLGSVVSAGVQYWLENQRQSRNLAFHQRKEAYLGLLEAWVRQENSGHDEKSLRDVGHWLLRCQLVASPRVHELLEAWENSEHGSVDRISVTRNLKKGMRKDLEF